MRKLSKRQKEVLEYIRNTWEKTGTFPTVREVSKALGLKSSGSGYFHLKALIKKGFLEQDSSGKFKWRGFREEIPRYIPLLGNIKAGYPVESPELIEDYIPVPNFLLKSKEEVFSLKVKGDSMENAHILEGDIVIVRKQAMAEIGDIVVALVGDETTIKFLKEKEGRLYLEPANPQYSPIFEPFTILGKVIGLMRKI
ncbi:MAG: transcriptional repressor LexA [Dictyoglomus sp.]|nr:transcriptional repressor LexA [Dictyoglomus sp.]MDW8188221.1 transcriptional repressor LexA [Dictyoglomus sp.]